MSNLPVEEKPAEGSKIASLAAMVKGFLPKISLDGYPVEPEKACEKLRCYRKFLMKKRANLKSGERTDVHVLAVLKQLESMELGALSKRLRIKTPEKEVPRNEEKSSSTEVLEPEKADKPGKPAAPAASNPKVILAAETESSWSAAQSLLAFFSEIASSKA